MSATPLLSVKDVFAATYQGLEKTPFTLSCTKLLEAVRVLSDRKWCSYNCSRDALKLHSMKFRNLCRGIGLLSAGCPLAHFPTNVHRPFKLETMTFIGLDTVIPSPHVEAGRTHSAKLSPTPPPQLPLSFPQHLCV